MTGFSVLMVCTGNICRSPAAERLLASAMNPFDGVTVSSAGIGAMVGQPIDGPTATLLDRRGVDTSAFASRSITPRMIEASDLILTMTRRQQSAVLLQVPSAGRRTFLLRELAMLVSTGETGAQAEAARAAEAQWTLPDYSTVDSATVESAIPDPADRLRTAISSATSARAVRGATRGLENFDIDDPYRQPDRVLLGCFARIEESITVLAEFLRSTTRKTPDESTSP